MVVQISFLSREMLTNVLEHLLRNSKEKEVYLKNDVLNIFKL